MAPLFRFQRSKAPLSDRLYVTSARPDLDEEELEMQPCAGGLFLLDTGARGVPDMPFAG